MVVGPENQDRDHRIGQNHWTGTPASQQISSVRSGHLRFRSRAAGGRRHRRPALPDGHRRQRHERRRLWRRARARVDFFWTNTSTRSNSATTDLICSRLPASTPKKPARSARGGRCPESAAGATGATRIYGPQKDCDRKTLTMPKNASVGWPRSSNGTCSWMQRRNLAPERPADSVLV